jgi:arylsulfatase A-like enzyme
MAWIGGEARSVLRPYRNRQIHAAAVEVPADGRLALTLPLPRLLADSDVVVLEARLKPAGAKERYTRAALVEVTPREVDGRAVVDLALALGAGAQPRRLDLAVQAWVPPKASLERFELPPAELPREATLEFAFGVLEVARERGPVRFRVEACTPGEPEECRELFAESVDPAAPGGAGWHDRRIPLESLAGQTRGLRFETQAAGDWSLPVWAHPTVLAPAPPPAQVPNVVLLSLDTLRADHLGSYGYARDTSPFFDAELARRGVLFEQAASASTTTTPSHMTLFTSAPPSVHQVLSVTGFAALPARVPTLAETLRAHGFATGAVTEAGALVFGRGFERGFDVYIENPVPVPHRAGAQSAVTFPRGLAWIERQRDRRFFLFLHTYEVHTPYAAPPEYAALFRDVPPGLEPDPRLAPHRQPALYDRGIRYLDDQLAAFVRGLEALGVLEDTLLVVTSDHGEEFYEHGFFAHGATLFEETVRVPLVLRGPGVARGRRVAEPVTLLDVMPTVLELAGVPAPAGLAGRSLAPLARGEPAQAEPRPVFSEAWLPYGLAPHGKQPVDQPTYAVRLGARKLVRYRAGDGHRYEYYDLARDPGEREDLYPTRAEEARDLRALLERYVEDTAARRRALAGDAAPRLQELDPESRESLRALGYLD